MANKREKNLWRKVKRRIAAWLLAGATALGGYALISQGTEQKASTNDDNNEIQQNEQTEDLMGKYELNYEIVPIAKQSNEIDEAKNYEQLKKAMLKDTKEDYIKQYNQKNGTNYKAEDIIFNMSTQDYIYKTQDGTYITHGKNPTVTRQSLINRGIDFNSISDVQSYTAFLENEEGTKILEQVGIVDWKSVPLNSNEEASLSSFYKNIEIAVRAERGEYGSLERARNEYYNIQQKRMETEIEI